MTEKDDDVHPVQETTTACQGMCDRRPDVIILGVRIDNDVTYRLALRDKIQSISRTMFPRAGEACG